MGPACRLLPQGYDSANLWNPKPNSGNTNVKINILLRIFQVYILQLYLEYPTIRLEIIHAPAVTTKRILVWAYARKAVPGP